MKVKTRTKPTTTQPQYHKLRLRECSCTSESSTRTRERNQTEFNFLYIVDQNLFNMALKIRLPRDPFNPLVQNGDWLTDKQTYSRIITSFHFRVAHHSANHFTKHCSPPRAQAPHHTQHRAGGGAKKIFDDKNYMKASQGDTLSRSLDSSNLHLNLQLCFAYGNIRLIGKTNICSLTNSFCCCKFDIIFLFFEFLYCASLPTCPRSASSSRASSVVGSSSLLDQETRTTSLRRVKKVTPYLIYMIADLLTPESPEVNVLQKYLFHIKQILLSKGQNCITVHNIFLPNQKLLQNVNSLALIFYWFAWS